MTIPANVLAKMATIGLSSEQAEAVASMLAAVEGATAAQYEAAAEVSKAKARARVQKWRERNVTERNTTSRNGLRAGDAHVEDKTSNLDIEPQKKEQKEGALSREFDQFWTVYPNKVGKPKARLALVKALKKASLETIIAGLRRYIASKPADRSWLNPATFLNDERWADQPLNVVPMARGSPLSMSDFLGDVIETREQRNAGPDSEIEGYPSHVRAISRSGWPG